MPCLFVRPIGFTYDQLNRLESLFAIAQGRLREQWRWATGGQADAYLVSVGAATEWDDYLAKYPPDRLIACVAADLEITPVWWINTVAEKTPGIPHLVRVLNAMGEQLASGAEILTGTIDEAPPAPVPVEQPLALPLNFSTIEQGPPSFVAPEPTPPPLAVAQPEPQPELLSLPRTEPRWTPIVRCDFAFHPEDYLLGIIRACQADGIARRLTCDDDGGTLVIDPDPKLYFVPSDKISLWPILSAPRENIDVRLISHEEVAREIIAIRSCGLVLEELTYLSVLIGSGGRLWAGRTMDEPVRLKRWPDLKNLSHFPDSVKYVRLAAFMSDHTANIKTIAAHTGIPEDKIINFHNAFEALGLLERGGTSTTVQPSNDSIAHDLYQKLATQYKWKSTSVDR